MSRFLQDHTQNLDIRTDSVAAKAKIAKGTKFGPFIAKFTEKPLDRRYAWEVSEIFTLKFMFTLAFRACEYVEPENLRYENIHYTTIFERQTTAATCVLND